MIKYCCICFRYYKKKNSTCGKQGERHYPATAVIYQCVCLQFSTFIGVCIISVTAGVPFNPTVISLSGLGLLTAPYCWKTRAGKEKNRERDGEKKGELEGEEGSWANYGPWKTKGYISMIPPAVLFMSSVLSRCVTFTSTLGLSEGKQAKMTRCSIFHSPLFFFFVLFFSCTITTFSSSCCMKPHM